MLSCRPAQAARLRDAGPGADPLKEPVLANGLGIGVVRVDGLELRVIAVPVAVEAHTPSTRPGHADPVDRIGDGREVRGDDDVVARTALEPAVPGEDLR